MGISGRQRRGSVDRGILFSVAGAAFQMDAFADGPARFLSKAHWTTHYHYDHSTGNAFFGANGIPLGRMPIRQKRIVESYGRCKAPTKPLSPGPSREGGLKRPKTETARKTSRRIFGSHNDGVQCVKFRRSGPSKSSPIDPAKLPIEGRLGRNYGRKTADRPKTMFCFRNSHVTSVPECAG